MTQEQVRWTAKDPILFAGGLSNLYEYCANDPVNYVDLDGLQTILTGPSEFIINKNISIVEKNIRLTERYSLSNPALQSKPSYWPILFRSMWFANKVRPGGDWDYKRLDRKFEDFGNFNYGVTGAALGYPKKFLMQMAGFIQILTNTSSPEFGDPFLRYPYGDDPKDQKYISDGFDYYHNKYKKTVSKLRL